MRRIAATTAAATEPPAPSTEIAANWADPAKVVIDMTMGAAVPSPAARARTPKDTPNPSTAIANGADCRTPSLGPRSADIPGL